MSRSTCATRSSVTHTHVLAAPCESTSASSGRSCERDPNTMTCPPTTDALLENSIHNVNSLPSKRESIGSVVVSRDVAIVPTGVRFPVNAILFQIKKCGLVAFFFLLFFCNCPANLSSLVFGSPPSGVGVATTTNLVLSWNSNLGLRFN